MNTYNDTQVCKYNLNDWKSKNDPPFESVSKSYIPMVDQSTNKNYDAMDNDNDNDNDCIKSITPTDLKALLTSTCQNKPEITYGRNFEICTEVVYALLPHIGINHIYRKCCWSLVRWTN
eukprot:UN08521